MALHYAIATPNFVIQEEVTGAVPWYGEVVKGPIIRKDGTWQGPDVAGLGIEVDEAVAARHPFAPEGLHTIHAVLADGTIVDWITMPGRLQNKVAIVTGASRGIGEAVAEAFVAEGAGVMIAELGPATGIATADRHRRQPDRVPARRPADPPLPDRHLCHVRHGGRASRHGHGSQSTR